MRGFGLSLVFVGELQCPVWTPAKIDRLKLTKICIIHNTASPGCQQLVHYLVTLWLQYLQFTSHQSTAGKLQQ